MHNHLRPFFSNCRLESPNFVHLQQKYQEERQLVYQDEKVLDESKRLRNHEQFQLRYLLLVQFLIDDNSQRFLKVDNAIKNVLGGAAGDHPVHSLPKGRINM